MSANERALAVFVDFENLALGFQGQRNKFEIHLALKRLVEKGKIIARKAYADWSRFQPYTASFHEAAFELIEIPKRSQTGKNSADIRLCVDAMDLAYSKAHIDTFVIVSGDSDFTPLVSKLKENGKHVIGMGMQGSTSELLRDTCDEFIYYEDLQRPSPIATGVEKFSDSKRKMFLLLLDSLLALKRENKEVLWSSLIKETMKRKKPAFNEAYHGYRTFSELLQDAQKEGLLELDFDDRSRSYVVTSFLGVEESAADRPAVGAASATRRRRRRRRGPTKQNGQGAESAAAIESPSVAGGPPQANESEVADQEAQERADGEPASPIERQ
jgi:uncharacterized protein (TIGR00288 family)